MEKRSNFLSFPRYFIYIFLTSGVKLHIHLLNVVVQFIVFLTLSTLIRRSTDISKCFSESLGIRDYGSRLYLQIVQPFVFRNSYSYHITRHTVKRSRRIYCKYWQLASSTCTVNFTGACRLYTITKTYLYNFDPLKPHFYIVKLGFTGVYIIFLISAQNINCGYSLEPPHRGGSNEYLLSMFCAEI